MPIDQDIYLPLCDFGRNGRAINETGEDSWSFDQIVEDLASGELTKVVAVIALNPVEGWSRDATDAVREATWQAWLAKGCPAPLPPFLDTPSTRRDMVLYGVREAAE